MQCNFCILNNLVFKRVLYHNVHWVGGACIYGWVSNQTARVYVYGLLQFSLNNANFKVDDDVD